MKNEIKEIPVVRFKMDYKKSWEKAVSTIYEKDKEIKRLNKECDTYMKIATKKQQLIDKAIDYTKWYFNHDYVSYEFKNTILGIFKGSDKK